MRSILLLLLFSYYAQAVVLDPYYKKASVKSSIDIMVPLTKLMSYDVSSDGHSIMIREASLDGILLSDNDIILDYFH